MKKLLIVGSIILGSIGFSTSAFAQLTEQQIKDIIVKEVPNGQITKFKLDKEHGKMVYEVEVIDGNVEKEFDIDAETGTVLKSESETKIALKESKNGKFKEIELKNKKGTLVYEVELNEGLMEREFIIDANTGEILKNKKGF